METICSIFNLLAKMNSLGQNTYIQIPTSHQQLSSSKNYEKYSIHGGHLGFRPLAELAHTFRRYMGANFLQYLPLIQKPLKNPALETLVTGTRVEGPLLIWMGTLMDHQRTEKSANCHSRINEPVKNWRRNLQQR